MEATIISKLIELGAAGAVIIVVIAFLKALEKRDAQFLQSQQARDKLWQDFFTELNRQNCEDGEKRMELTEKILNLVEAVVRELKQHDAKVDERIRQASKATVEAVHKVVGRKGETRARTNE